MELLLTKFQSDSGSRKIIATSYEVSPELVTQMVSMRNEELGLNSSKITKNDKHATWFLIVEGLGSNRTVLGGISGFIKTPYRKLPLEREGWTLESSQELKEFINGDNIMEFGSLNISKSLREESLPRREKFREHPIHTLLEQAFIYAADRNIHLGIQAPPKKTLFLLKLFTEASVKEEEQGTKLNIFGNVEFPQKIKILPNGETLERNLCILDSRKKREILQNIENSNDAPLSTKTKLDLTKTYEGFHIVSGFAEATSVFPTFANLRHKDSLASIGHCEESFNNLKQLISMIETNSIPQQQSDPYKKLYNEVEAIQKEFKAAAKQMYSDHLNSIPKSISRAWTAIKENHPNDLKKEIRAKVADNLIQGTIDVFKNLKTDNSEIFRFKNELSKNLEQVKESYLKQNSQQHSK